MAVTARAVAFRDEIGTVSGKIFFILFGDSIARRTAWLVKFFTHRYHAALSAADLIRYVCDHYHRGCFQIRNEWMVDHSARLIAAFTGEKGGTKNTIDYAARKGVQTIFVL